MKACWKVRELKSPIHGRPRGFRLVAVTPNKDATNPFNGKPMTSYRQQYVIYQLGDYCTEADALRHFKQFEAVLRLRFKITEFVE